MSKDGRAPSIVSEHDPADTDPSGPATGPTKHRPPGANQHRPQGPNRHRPPGPDPDGDLTPDVSPVELRRELRRRVNAGPADPRPGDTPPSTGGRHARRDGENRNPRADYVPRHAIRTPGPGAISANQPTEQFARVREDPTEPPMPARPDPVRFGAPAPPEPTPTTAPAPAVGRSLVTEPANGARPTAPGKRVRVVLAQRKGSPRPVRTVVDVQELTKVGEVLSSSLIRSQLALALRIGGIALIALGSLPAIFVIFPVLGRFELFGLRLPWLLLGVLSYPFLLALGWMHARSAERLEQVFADHIQS